MAETPRVVVIAPGYDDYQEENAALAGLAEVEEIAWNGDTERLANGLKHADLVLVRDARVDAGLIASMERVRGILRYGVGYDTVDVEAARRRHIYVTNVPDYGAAIDVSDHAAALLLDLCRRVTTRDRAVRSGRWNIAQQEPIRRISELSLGLVGYGKIARELHRKMSVFGVAPVYVADPYLTDDEVSANGAVKVELDQLFGLSDLISLNAPGRTDGEPIIDRRLLELVRTGARIINTARGTLIDEEALVDALNIGKLGGAGLDVFRTEPLPADSALRNAPNLILTDHVAWYSEASVRTLQSKVGEQAHAILSGGVPLNWVNPWQ
jgi:D-3-phosphoglycerate dehydrogenase